MNATKTEPLYTAQDKQYPEMSASVYPHPRGYSVVLWDADANQSAGCVIVRDLNKAKEHADFLCH